MLKIKLIWYEYNVAFKVYLLSWTMHTCSLVLLPCSLVVLVEPVYRRYPWTGEKTLGDATVRSRRTFFLQ
jgi:hypothetical protein